MITVLNSVIDAVEEHLTDDLDIAALARELGSTEYHLRRMFSSLAGMPLSDYVRRRRMTVAAGEVVAGGELLEIAVRFGYGSTEAFGRAFRRCTESARQTFAGTAAPFAHNHSSGSA